MAKSISVATIAMVFVSHASLAQNNLTTLYSFAKLGTPQGEIAMDSNSDIFAVGRGGDSRPAIYEISPPAAGQKIFTETSVFAFNRKSDGDYPMGGITRADDGTLYGTTARIGRRGCGTAFSVKQVSNAWKGTVLWHFGMYSGDGCSPATALVLGGNGTLYGNTTRGGAYGRGAAFQIVPPRHGSKAAEAVIWSFDNADDGEFPSTTMVSDKAGNLYGGSSVGGPDGFGTIWELSPPADGATMWTRAVLWSFKSSAGGQSPGGNLVMDRKGALYGTCEDGGTGYGVAFKLTPPGQNGTKWQESAIYAFDQSLGQPSGGLVMVSDGSLIGPSTVGKGSIYKLIPPAEGQTAWTETTLWQFSGTDGSNPNLPLLASGGDLIGTTAGGGANGLGTVWQLSP